MHLSSVLSAVVLACTFQHVFTAPIPQLGGEGAACDSVFSSTDNGVGFAVENAEDNTANNVNAAKGAVPPAKRQLAGEGAACNSVLSSTDNGVGYGIENAEDNTAKNIGGVTGQAGGAAGGATGGAGGQPPPPGGMPGPMNRRQLDKIANGLGAIGNAAGAGVATDPVVGEGDSLDGTLTGGAAMAGQMAGDTEAGTLEGAGAAVP